MGLTSGPRKGCKALSAEASPAAHLSSPRAATAPPRVCGGAPSPPRSRPGPTSGFHSTQPRSWELGTFPAAEDRAAPRDSQLLQARVAPGTVERRQQLALAPGLRVGSAAGAGGEGLARPGSDLPGLGGAGAGRGASALHLRQLRERVWCVKGGVGRMREREGPGIEGRRKKVEETK